MLVRDAPSKMLLNITLELVVGKILYTGEWIKLQDQKTIKSLANRDDIALVATTKEDLFEQQPVLI